MVNYRLLLYAFENSRLWAGWRKKGVAGQTDWLQSGLYEFTRCVTIKGLSLLDMIHNIDFMSCLTARPWPLNFVRRRWTVLYDWLCVCDSVLSGGWTTSPELRETEDDRTRRMTDWIIPPPRGVLRRENNLLLMTAPWRLYLSCVAVEPRHDSSSWE